ncbi:hypothetical protein [Changchengzhania lutea]|uniref:hypothetical protein n=1 Tax=Changchengzhania lutea TaxID=2049305 RepID=UPI00163D403B|nr:hypothetical protein [Changchengzhania lutea]
MKLKDKILACHGNLIAKSTAKACGCSLSQVYNIWGQNNLFSIKNNKRKAPKWI